MKKADQKNSIPTSTAEINKLRDLSESVGDFIRYWGFRRIHGQIWTQVFLSKTSLSGAELTQRLGVSKALISPALSELEAYGLILMTEDGKKTKRYSAAPNVIPVIKDILKEREAKIIATAQEKFGTLHKIHEKRGEQESLLQHERVEELGQMITLAQFALNFIIGQSDEESLACWTEEAMKADT
ncbi:GbsR/MarR family transcriptional regulator [Bdellovibrio bacteriovorus]|uniref:GbsR/MarR family transcriptional regulator n=1 Tax=Bdellovibrio bacteriovorus TaxID=959 RepID=UPI003AA8C686